MKVLIADRDRAFCETVVAALSPRYKVVIAVDEQGFRNHFGSVEIPDVVVLNDIFSDSLDALLSWLKDICPQVHVIVMCHDERTLLTGGDYIEQPFNAAKIMSRVGMAERILSRQEKQSGGVEAEAEDERWDESDDETVVYLLDSLDAMVHASEFETHKLIYMNTAAHEVFGGEPGDDLWALMAEDKIQPTPRYLDEKLIDSEGRPCGSYVWEFKHLETGAWYLCRDQAVHWLDGRLVHLSIATSITDRVRAEELLRASEQGLRTIHDAAFEAIFLSENGICLSQNLAAKKTFGYTLEEAVGKPLTEWVVKEDRERLLRNMGSGFELPYEVTSLRKDGSTFAAEIQARMIQYQGRQVRMSALRDITDRKKTAEITLAHERRFRGFFDSMNDAIFVCPGKGDKERNIIEVNETACSMYGFTRQEFLQMTLKDLSLVSSLGDEGEGGHAIWPDEGLTCEAVHITRNGKLFPVEVSTRIVDQFGSKVVLVVVRDISERKRAEEEAREQERRFADYFSSVNDAIVVHPFEEDGQPAFITEVNDAACRMYGYTLEEVKKLRVPEVYLDGDYERIKEKYREQLVTNKHLVFETVHVKKTGAIFPVEVSVNVIERQGKVMMLSVIRDITERKEAEKIAYAHEQRFKVFFDSLNDAIFVHPVQDTWPGQFIEVNETACRLFGYSREELLGMTAKDLSAGTAFEERISDGVRDRLMSEKQLVFESMGQKKSGEEFPVEVSINVVERFGQQVMLAVVRDISERKAIEQKAQELEQRYKLFFNSVNDAIFVYPLKNDGPANFIEVNDTACRRSGYSREEFLNMNPAHLAHDTHAERGKWKELLEKKQQVFETTGSSRTGEQLTVEVNRNIVESSGEQMVFSVVRDITQRKQAEEKARILEHRFKAFFDSVNDAIFVSPYSADGPGPFIEVNERACQVSGYSREELLQMTSADLGPEVSADVERWNSLEEDGRQIFETVGIKKSGETARYEISRNLVDWYGQRVILSCVRDISARDPHEHAS